MPRPFDFRWSLLRTWQWIRQDLAAKDGSGNQSNDDADGQGLHEGVGHIDEGVLVESIPRED